ncbi:CU044_2847 family protein [Micromonospora sp. NPDC049559]|uniref:CU044_2847 family protein n=1 Tax=Micromonospora sp. NPDC049559 TaxID=3155923 RepID=UPI00344A1485
MDGRVEYLDFGDGDALPIQPTAPARPAGSPFSAEPQPVARRGEGEPAARLTERVEESIDRIRRFGAMAAERLAEMPRTPDRVSVALAVTVSAEAGVMLARCATEANLTISVEWGRETREVVTSVREAAGAGDGPAATGPAAPGTAAGVGAG